MKEKVLFWIGEQKSPVKVDRSEDYVMDSIIHYYQDINPILKYSTKRLFLDNGAYTARMKGIELVRERVIDIQEKLKPELTIPLDFPFTPGDSINRMKELWKKTSDNIIFWQNSSSLKEKLVPTLHSWSASSLQNNLKWLVKNANSDMISVGSLVDYSFSEFNGFFGDRQPRIELIELLARSVSIMQKNSDFNIHLLGMGSSPLTLNLVYYLGFRSTDSAGTRRKAAHGKVIFPGMGELYCGYGTASFGRSISDTIKIIKEKQKECECPICRTDPTKIVSNDPNKCPDWKDLAIHNEYVMKKERETAEKLLSMGIEYYEKYLDGIFERSSLRYLWEHAKLCKKMYKISDVI